VLVSKHRPQNVVDARFMIIAAIRERLRLPVKRIGQLFNRDHTSVLHAIKTVQNLCHTDAIYRQQYKDFKQFINDKI
jgi:chromosomal replication initiation ATPase DnaA